MALPGQWISLIPDHCMSPLDQQWFHASPRPACDAHCNLKAMHGMCACMQQSFAADSCSMASTKKKGKNQQVQTSLCCYWELHLSLHLKLTWHTCVTAGGVATGGNHGFSNHQSAGHTVPRHSSGLCICCFLPHLYHFLSEGAP